FASPPPPCGLSSSPTRRSSDLESASALISANDLGGMLEGISILKDLLDSHDEAALVAIVGPVSRLPFRGITKFLLQLLQDSNVKDRKSTRLNSSQEWSSYAVFI